METRRLFISYCHRDEKYRQVLDTHLAPLVRDRTVVVWHDRKISPGAHWDEVICDELDSADIFVFLVSPDFVASEYCFGKELAHALERHKKGEAIVLPVIIRPVDWQTTALSQIQGLPKDAIPISTWPNQDEAWLEVVQGIRSLCSRQKPAAKAASSTSNVKLAPSSIHEVLIGVVERIQEIHDADEPVSGIPTGLLDFDQQCDGLHLGEVVVVASVPQIDRLALLIRLVAHFAAEIRIPCTFACAKYDKELIARRMLGHFGKLPPRKISLGQLSDDQWSRLSYALGKLKEAPLAFVSCAGQQTDSLLPTLDELTEQFGALPVVVIDSLEHLSGDKIKVLQTLRKYAAANRKLVIVGCGLEKDPNQRPNKRPVLTDLGRDLLEFVDRVIFFYVDQAYNPDTADLGTAELLVHDLPNGRTSIVRLFYSPELQILDNLVSEKGPSFGRPSENS